MVGLQLIHVMAISYPEEQVLEDSGTTSPRLIDDAFGKICNAVQDLSVQVRGLSVKLIGTLHNVSPWFLEQTLDKKLMSNMRSKKSAHERQAQVVASGEWSSGKKWADDAPREEVDADSVNLMAMGACGAFIHGLEDEFLAVSFFNGRFYTIYCKQCIKSLVFLNVVLHYIQGEVCWPHS